MPVPFLGNGSEPNSEPINASSQGIAEIRSVAGARLSKIERYLADNISYSRLSELRRSVNKEM
jgi:hypothetical protein